MPWIGAIGAAVAGVFGASLAAGGLASMVIGGAIVGAAVGALYTAVTGGDILMGVLYGALGGAVLGGVGSYLGFGAEVVTNGMSTIGAGETMTVGGKAITWGGTTGGILETGSTVVPKVIVPAATKLFTADSIAGTGAIASLGSAFLAGGNQLDPDAQLAEAEKNRQLERDLAAQRSADAKLQAEAQYGAVIRKTESDERMAAEKLKFDREAFEKEFGESQFRYRDEKEQAETARQRFEQGIGEASDYVAGNMKQLKEERQGLPSPVWRSKLQYSTQQGAA